MLKFFQTPYMQYPKDIDDIERDFAQGLASDRSLERCQANHFRKGLEP